MNADRPGPYRARNGFLLGVLRGLCNYSGLSLFWTRLVYVLVTLFTGVWPGVGVYLLAALLLKPEPPMAIPDSEARDLYDAYAASPRAALKGLKRRFETLERRIRRMEDVVTSREFDWERRLRR